MPSRSLEFAVLQSRQLYVYCLSQDCMQLQAGIKKTYRD